MKLYWPCGKYIDSDRKEDMLFTYDASVSEEKARKTIKNWAVHYKHNITEAWIDVYEDNEKVSVIHCTEQDYSR